MKKETINKIMIKRIANIAAFLVAVVFIGSCKKDVTELPLSSASQDNYFRTAKDITSALAGLYGSFQTEMTGDGTGNGKYFYWGEGRSDNFAPSGYASSPIIEMSTNNLTAGDTYTDWAGLYRTISRANVCIKYIPQVPQYDNNVTSFTVNNALAQAYAMRAESYFYIVRLWGDAPVWTEPYLDPAIPGTKAKTSQATIIDSVIIPDLKRAYSLIQKQQTANIWYINEATICAMLADVYMWKNNPYPQFKQTPSVQNAQNAITWIQALFAAKNGVSGTYTGGAANIETTANWKNVFITPLSSIESIWSINWDYTVNSCACIPVGVQNSNNPIEVDPFFQASWKRAKNTDTRVLKCIDTLTNTGHIDKIYKYYNFTFTSGGLPAGTQQLVLNTYLVMYRLSDIYLLYAEALAYTGDLPNALKYLNYIYLRARVAGTPAIPATQYTTTAAMEDAILQERQYELFGEGKRWFDLVRTGRVNQIMDPVLMRRQIPPTPQIGFSPLDKLLSPISRKALDANNLLTQNPSYN
jgi:hypothetical protein